MDTQQINGSSLRFGVTNGNIVVTSGARRLRCTRHALTNIAATFNTAVSAGLNGTLIQSISPELAAATLNHFAPSVNKPLVLYTAGDQVIGASTVYFTTVPHRKLADTLRVAFPDYPLTVVDEAPIRAEFTLLRPQRDPRLGDLEIGVRVTNAEVPSDTRLDSIGCIAVPALGGAAILRAAWASERGHKHYRRSVRALLELVTSDTRSNLDAVESAVRRAPGLHRRIPLTARQVLHQLHKRNRRFPYRLFDHINAEYSRQAGDFGRTDLAWFAALLKAQAHGSHIETLALTAGDILKLKFQEETS